MVSLVGGSTCTNTIGNVCNGDASRLMPLDHLPLAEYLDHFQAEFPSEFGGRVGGPTETVESSVSVAPSDFNSNESTESTTSIDSLGDVSERCFHQLEL